MVSLVALGFLSIALGLLLLTRPGPAFEGLPTWVRSVDPTLRSLAWLILLPVGVAAVGAAIPVWRLGRIGWWVAVIVLGGVVGACAAIFINGVDGDDLILTVQTVGLVAAAGGFGLLTKPARIAYGISLGAEASDKPDNRGSRPGRPKRRRKPGDRGPGRRGGGGTSGSRRPGGQRPD